MTYAAVVLGLLGGIVSAVVAGLVTRPINRLAGAARMLAEGNLDAPVPVAGASEIRQLSKTLSNMATSIRDLVRREQTLRMQAEAASRMKDDFLATLSHELRTPLNAILGWASILARTDQDRARVSHAVRVIERNARVQSQMVEELLDVSRIATGRVRLNVSDVLIAPAIDAALESVRPAAEAKNVALRKEIDPAARTTRADARRLQQIIWNLSVECRAVHACRWSRRGDGSRRRARIRRDRRRRYRMRHRSGISAARVRTFPSGRQQHDAHAWRSRAGSGHRARPGRDAWRHGARGERRHRPGHDVHGTTTGCRLSGNPTRRRRAARRSRRD